MTIPQSPIVESTSLLDRHQLVALMFFMSLAYLLLGIDIGVIIASGLQKARTVEIAPIPQVSIVPSGCYERERITL